MFIHIPNVSVSLLTAFIWYEEQIAAWRNKFRSIAPSRKSAERFMTREDTAIIEKFARSQRSGEIHERDRRASRA